MLKRLPFLFFSLFLVSSFCAGVCEAKTMPAGHMESAGLAAVQTKISKSRATHVKKDFYDDRKHGWYWYEKEPVVKQKPSGKTSGRLLDKYSYKRLWDMDPDTFQALQTRFLKKAVQRPDEKTVKDYMILQDIARRKALAFAGVMSYVAQAHPELTTKADYPVTAPGQSALSVIKMSEEDNTIKKNRNHFALIMFSQKGCHFCEAQKSILDYFVDKYAWPVRDVDLRKNPNMAARFNIKTTPTIILVEKKSKKYMPISAGVISMTELSLKLYRTIRYMEKDITPQQWFMHDFEKDRGNDALKYIKTSN